MSGNDKGLCCDCGDNGMVSVPHPNFCNAIEWRPTHYRQSDKMPVYATASVLCRCHVGRRCQDRQRDESNKDRPKCMTLDWYETNVNGNWREQMNYRDELNQVQQPGSERIIRETANAVGV